MSIKETFEKKGTWELVYVIGFYLVISRVISDLVDNSIERISLTFIGLIIGAALGLGIYRLVRTKTHLTKSIVMIAGIVIISVLSIPLQSYAKKATHEGCNVCGFISVDKENHECQMCASKKWDDQLMTGYADKEEYIKEEQLFWFSTMSSTEKVNFYLPEGEKNKGNYPKNENWKPLVTEEEVIEYSRKDWRQ